MIPILSLYRIRHSKRAKYLQLKVTLRGIELIVPNRMSLANPAIDAFLQEKQSWILQHAHTAKQHTLTLPHHIELLAMGLSYNITYVQTTRKKLSLYEVKSGELAMMGDVKNYSDCIRVLKNWLKARAKHYFSLQLAELAEEHRLPYRMLSVRYMKTRWGSCSSEKNINLCVHVLFLPAHLSRYVLLHELSHTKVMNHSATFWRELSKYDAKAFHHASELKTAAKYLPVWIYD